jgi:tRNA-dihydrouridine synthase B
MVAQTGCDAVMIGRMAPANPWIFRQIEQYCNGVGRVGPRSELALSGAKGPGSTQSASPYHEPSEADRYQMIRTYFEMLIEEEMPGAEGKMKQFASWFTHGVAGGAALRKAIYESKSRVEILTSVEAFFESRLELCTPGTLGRESVGLTP